MGYYWTENSPRGSDCIKRNFIFIAETNFQVICWKTNKKNSREVAK